MIDFVENLSAYLKSISGTSAGFELAVILAITSAFCHAVFGAINKGAGDPMLTRGGIDINYGLLSAPIALFIVPWPSTETFSILAFAVIAHFLYKYCQVKAYQLGAYTVVYPISRGIGVFVIAILGGVIFDEHFSAGQWGGLFILSTAICGLAFHNLQNRIKPIKSFEIEKPETFTELKIAIIFAVATGIGVAAYTTIDAIGVRDALNPFTFIAWLFMLDGISFAPVSFGTWLKMKNRPSILPYLYRGFIATFIAFVSFGSVMIATMVGGVAEAAALRETSVIFALLIGAFIFKEQLGIARALSIIFIGIGAVIVQMA